jgi:hypothetical protein
MKDKWEFIKPELNDKMIKLFRELEEMQKFFWNNPDVKEIIEPNVLNSYKGLGIDL